MRRAVTALVGLIAASWVTLAQADVTVLAVRLGANDVAALAKFYDAAFGLKPIDQVGTPPTEIIMRYGATVAAAKAGTSPEFLVQLREPGAGKSAMATRSSTCRMSPLPSQPQKPRALRCRARWSRSPSAGMPVKIATVVDPDGNVLELMELPKGATHLPHP